MKKSLGHNAGLELLNMFHFMKRQKFILKFFLKYRRKGGGILKKKSLTRIMLFAAVVILLAFLFQQFAIHFSGDGFDKPEEALPKDGEYEWIEGPKSEKEQRYFFLSNGNDFGTVVVKKNMKGWTRGELVSGQLPDSLEENKISSAYSDEKILFGLINRKGKAEVEVNGKKADFIELSSLPKDTLELYGVDGYSIWYVDLENLKETEHFHIKVKDEKGEITSELSI